MNYRLVLLLWLLNYSSALDPDCDYRQNIPVGGTRYINSPNYPNSYPRGKECRWIADCPAGYNCRVDCPDIRIPKSESCSMDRLLVSTTGDPQLTGADRYCGTEPRNVTSTNQRIAIGLIASPSSPGGRFQCTVTAQAILATKTPKSACTCGLRRQNRIVGGQETGVNEFPMMAGLVDVKIGKIKCGAVIISEKHVLTAAQCVINQPVHNFGVIVGAHDVTTVSESTQFLRISEITVHPSYNDSNYDNDIAVVVVASKIRFSELVLAVCLPFRFLTNDFAGTKVAVLGWGALKSDGPNSNVLMKVDLDVLQQSDCRARGAAVTDRQMCTFTSGKNACQDDTGGPLLWTDPLTGAVFNVGIVSHRSRSSCESDKPGINTRITSLLSWIENVAPYNYCRK